MAVVGGVVTVAVAEVVLTAMVVCDGGVCEHNTIKIKTKDWFFRVFFVEFFL